jgi:hypothetical protein
MKVREVRYLTDGRNSMEVVVYENGVPDLTVRNIWCAPEKEIFDVIAEAFDTGIISEYEAQEEWDAHEMAKKDRQRARRGSLSVHRPLKIASRSKRPRGRLDPARGRMYRRDDRRHCRAHCRRASDRAAYQGGGLWLQRETN